MKHLLFLLTGCLTALPLLLPAEDSNSPMFLLQPNDVLVICGDSITNAKEYPAYIEDYLLMCQPVPGIRVAQFGISGEKAGGFLKRMENDVLPFKPTAASICYGMNDGTYKYPDIHVTEDYRSNQTKIIGVLKASGVRTGVLASPGVVDEFYRKDKSGYNETLAGLRDVAREVAAKEGFAFADLHSLMLETMKSAKAAYGEDYVFAGGDGVHPAPPGHLTMAYGILRALGCDGTVGTFTVDLNSGKAEASEGHTLVSFSEGKMELESRRYPFCFTAPGAVASPKKGLEPILPHLLFNQDLNRFMLIVKGLNGKPATITWGTESKEFTTESLEKGVNLAAEFLINPFSEPFYTVHKAVREQQKGEGEDMRKIMNPLMKEPDKAKADQIKKDTVAASQQRADAVAALVVPVKHTIRIEPRL